MTSTELHPPLHPPSGDVVDDTLPLIDLVPVAGPPVFLVAGPLVLFALLLVGPFAFLAVLVVVLAAAAALVALAGAVLASPFLLVRHLREHRTDRTPSPSPSPAPVPFTAHPLGVAR